MQGRLRPGRRLTEVVQTYEYPTTGLHSFILILFEKYSNLLEKQFGKRFKDVRVPVTTIFCFTKALGRL